MNLVVFTGAGAARADGIPSQPDLFARFFTGEPQSAGERGLRERLQRFLHRVFFIDFEQPVKAWPSFEEVLGVIDLAGLRREAIREVLADGHPQADSVEQVRQTVVLAMAHTVSRSEPERPEAHSTLISELKNVGQLSETVFVTTNYDRCIEKGITSALAAHRETLLSPIDYGLDGLIGNAPSEGVPSARYAVYKIHGSLNWIVCPVCDELQIKYASDVVARMINDAEEAACPRCGASWSPVIVPPTYYKEMSNVYLSTVWTHATNKLRAATDIVFCGYSFPDADMHVKYLIKRAQLNRDVRSEPLRVTLVNRGPSAQGNRESEELAIAANAAVRSRYVRFLGSQHVRDANCSFAEFAADPIRIIERSHAN
jgi:NAD-dependent SIR2 family protein deacetylase